MSITAAELKKMTVKALREYAQENTSLVGTTGMKKDELLTSIMDELGIVAEEAPEEAPKAAPKKAAKKTAKKTSKVDFSDPKTVKAEISRLKEKQVDALKDSKKNANVLKNIRRRIRSLKRGVKKAS